ncbi:DDE_4 domain-containing protein [Gossypium australe]|uniref:DDE_4 domain-containing protein n=1 Tax=Gossypium australe TaxID=47621 RepID=A0A5B6WTV5_9ROSI|nr:DDE_4 domain-containing protein [Gossypium australe]
MIQPMTCENGSRTHVKIQVPREEKPRYRTRKNEVAINVLGACALDMQYTYVLSGWEGSTASGRVTIIIRLPTRHSKLLKSKSCLTKLHTFKMVFSTFRGQRYHLTKLRCGYQPTTAKEFFNIMHASIRNIFEKCFNFSKMIWGILRSPSFYPIKIQNQIIFACCLLHIYIQKEMSYDPLECDDESSSGKEVDDIYTYEAVVSGIEPRNEWNMSRQQFTTEMFNE